MFFLYPQLEMAMTNSFCLFITVFVFLMFISEEQWLLKFKLGRIREKIV